MIGAGPAGLHAAFYAAFRGLRVEVIEAAEEPGGQLSALYPDKHIYDWPGLPGVRAAQAVDRLVRQLRGLPVTLRCSQVARELRPWAGGGNGSGWEVVTDDRVYAADAVVVAAGLGTLLPREPTLPGAGEHPDLRTGWRSLLEAPPQPVLVVGGVPQASRAALALARAGHQVTLTHRRAGFRGQPEDLRALEMGEPGLRVLAPATLATLTPQGAELDWRGERLSVEAPTVVFCGGVLPDLTPVQGWPLGWEGEYVPDGPGGATCLPGVFVAGDVARSSGEFKLLSVALAQAALAANHAVHHVRPDLRARPGHSSERAGPEGTEAGV